MIAAADSDTRSNAVNTSASAVPTQLLYSNNTPRAPNASNAETADERTHVTVREVDQGTLFPKQGGFVPPNGYSARKRPDQPGGGPTRLTVSLAPVHISQIDAAETRLMLDAHLTTSWQDGALGAPLPPPPKPATRDA